jgi:hypothetical protein
VIETKVFIASGARARAFQFRTSNPQLL